MQGEIEHDPLQGRGGSLCARHEEVKDAADQLEHVELLALVLGNLGQVNIDEVLLVVQLQLCLVLLHLGHEVVPDIEIC